MSEVLSVPLSHPFYVRRYGPKLRVEIQGDCLKGIRSMNCRDYDKGIDILYVLPRAEGG